MLENGFTRKMDLPEKWIYQKNGFTRKMDKVNKEGLGLWDKVNKQGGGGDKLYL